MCSGLFSYADELYSYGQPCEPYVDHFMLKVNKVTHLWEPTSYVGAPKKTWNDSFHHATGMLQGNVAQLQESSGRLPKVSLAFPLLTSVANGLQGSHSR